MKTRIFIYLKGYYRKVKIKLDYCKKHSISKFIFPIVLISIIYIFFNNLFEEAITNCFVRPFLSRFNSEGSLRRLIIYIISFYIIYRIGRLFFFKKRKKIDFNNFILFVPLVIFYLYYRLYPNSPWIFYPINQTLAYSDITILAIWVSLIRSNLRKSSPKPTFNLKLIEDSFNTFGNKDQLERHNTAERITKYIQSTNTKKTFAIGISGKWGSGKSVLLELIEKQLTLTEIVISYTPWKREKEVDIIKDFFNKLENSLRIGNNNKLADGIINYSRSILKNNSNSFIQAFDFIFDKVFNTQDKDDIMGKTKLVILLDDLDRLDKNEILEILKLVRNSFDFPNTFFVVTYDREHITKLLCEESESYKQYLDKIFQLEIPLPISPENLIISNTVKLLINKKLDEEAMLIKGAIDHLTFHKLIEEGQERNIFSFFITNLRDAVRFVNSFNFNYTDNIKDEVDLQDFIILEFLKVKYSFIYELLKEDYYFNNHQGILKLRNIDGLNFIQQLDKRYNNYLLPSEVGGINYTLTMLFPESGKPTSLESIRYNTNKLTYFSSQLFNKVTPGAIKKVRARNSIEEIYNQVNLWVQEKCAYEAYELVKRIGDFDNFQDFRNVIYCFGYLSSVLKSSDFLSVITSRIKAWYLSNKNLLELQTFLVNFLSDNKVDDLLRSNICFELITDQFNKSEITIDIDLFLFKKLNFSILKSFNLNGDSRIFYQLLIRNVGSIKNSIYQITEDSKSYVREILVKNPELVKDYFDNILVPFYKENSKMEAFIFQKQLIQLFEDYFEEFVNKQSPSIEKYEIQTFLRKTTPQNRELRTARYNIEIVSDSETKYYEPSSHDNLEVVHYSHLWDDRLKNDPFYVYIKDARWLAHAYPITDEDAIKGGIYQFNRELFFDYSRYKLISAEFYYVVDDILTLRINQNEIITKSQPFNHVKELIINDLSIFVSGKNLLTFMVENSPRGENAKWSRERPKGADNPYGLKYNLVLQFEKIS